MMAPLADPNEIERSLCVLFSDETVSDEPVTELRVPNTERDGTVSGYFNDRNKLAQEIAQRNGSGPGVYITLNPVKPALLARAENRVKTRVRVTTTDANIERRRWVLIDCDPVRPSGISSSDAEHAAALELARAIRQVLRDLGWPEPILIDSGNGAHLLYRIDLPNDEPAQKLIENVLKALASKFNDSMVSVDTAVYNAARIVKAYGTVAAKGDSTAERPHRLSRMLEVPAKLTPVPRELLESLAAQAAAPQAPPPHTPPRPAGIFNLEQFIARHLKAREPVGHQAGRKWVLEECPFNPEHKDAAVFESSDGKFGFHCFHESCSTKSWHEVRKLFEGPLASRKVTNSKVSADEREPEPEPDSAAPLDGAEIVRQVEAQLKKYLILPVRAYLPMAIWILGTFIFKIFDCYAYLAILSPTKRCGKSRLQEVLETLAAEARHGTSPSPAALYRLIDRGVTLLIDEIEPLKAAKSEVAQILISVLNAGHRKGAKVARCDGPQNEVREFDTYGPKAFGAIGTLPDTLLDRSIIVTMQRKRKDQKVTRFFFGRATREGKTIQADIRFYLQKFRGAIQEIYENQADLEYLGDRDADIWLSLMAICAVADAARMEELKQCAIALSERKNIDEEAEPYNVKLLADIREVWPTEDKTPKPHCSSANLLSFLQALPESRWTGGKRPLTQRRMADLLRLFDVSPRQIKTSSGNLRGYEYLPLENAFASYLRNQSATSATDQYSQASEANSQSATEGFGSTSENASGANNDGPGSTSSTSKPKVDGPTGSWTVEI